jgi:hypothetical protein
MSLQIYELVSKLNGIGLYEFIGNQNLINNF